jgi:hypothetical protein
MAGVYTVGFQLVDANHIQTSSQMYYITFVAGTVPIPEPQTVTLLLGGTLVGGVVWFRSRRKAGRA